MVISVALLVCQLKTVDWPCCMVSGVADRAAVGAAGGGGVAGCSTFAIFLPLQETRRRAAVNVNIRKEKLRLKVAMVPPERRIRLSLLIALGFQVQQPRMDAAETVSLGRQHDPWFKRNQQRRTAFACRSSQADCPRPDDEHAPKRLAKESRATRLKAAITMDQNSRTDARSARNAVTGPWTAEYGPTGAEKRKMPRVHKITITDNSGFRRRLKSMAWTQLYIARRPD